MAKIYHTNLRVLPQWHVICAYGLSYINHSWPFLGPHTPSDWDVVAVHAAPIKWLLLKLVDEILREAQHWPLLWLSLSGPSANIDGSFDASASLSWNDIIVMEWHWDVMETSFLPFPHSPAYFIVLRHSLLSLTPEVSKKNLEWAAWSSTDYDMRRKIGKVVSRHPSRY